MLCTWRFLEKMSASKRGPGLRNGNVDLCGMRRIVNLAFTPDVVLADFVLIQSPLRSPPG